MTETPCASAGRWAAQRAAPPIWCRCTKRLGRQTMKVVREGSKNRFGQRLLDDFIRVGENSPAARYVQEANEYEHEFTPDTLDDMSREQLTKDKTLTVFKDGKLWELTVDDTMFDALKALSPDAAESNAVTRAVRTANNLFKALVTGYNPTFTIRNTVRDLQTAGLYTRDGVAFARNYPKALAEIKNNGEYWQMYKALGGSFSSVFDYNTGTVKEPKGRTAKLMAKIEASEHGHGAGAASGGVHGRSGKRRHQHRKSGGRPVCRR